MWVLQGSEQIDLMKVTACGDFRGWTVVFFSDGSTKSNKETDTVMIPVWWHSCDGRIVTVDSEDEFVLMRGWGWYLRWSIVRPRWDYRWLSSGCWCPKGRETVFKVTDVSGFVLWKLGQFMHDGEGVIWVAVGCMCIYLGLIYSVFKVV